MFEQAFFKGEHGIQIKTHSHSHCMTTVFSKKTNGIYIWNTWPSSWWYSHTKYIILL